MFDIPFLKWTVTVSRKACLVAAIFLTAALAMAGYFAIDLGRKDDELRRVSARGADTSADGGIPGEGDVASGGADAHDAKTAGVEQSGGEKQEGSREGSPEDAAAGAATGGAPGEGALFAGSAETVDSVGDSAANNGEMANASSEALAVAGSDAGLLGSATAGAEPYAAMSGKDAGAGEEKIYLYLTGAVKSPGVYELPRYSMIVDAVAAAGGFTDSADKANVNLVYRLDSNAMIRVDELSVPNTDAQGTAADETITGKSNSPDAADGSASAGKSGKPGHEDSGGDRASGSSAEVIYSYDDVTFATDGARVGSAKDASGSLALVNINTASALELSSLPGIGLTTAKKICEYRQSRNGFAATEDIMGVSGIKQSKYDAIKDLITV